MRCAALLLLVAAACASSNASIFAGMEEQARRHPRPDLDPLLESLDPVPLESKPRPQTLAMLAGSLPTVRGRVNGTVMDLVVDTGTSHVGLPAHLARDAGAYLPAAKEVLVIAPGRDNAHRLCVFDSVRLGALEFGKGKAFVPVRERRRERRGIVGSSILSHFRVTFDFKHREVRLVPHHRAAHAGVLFTQVKLNGTPYSFLVDSGANHLALEPWVTRELGLKGRRLLLETVEVAGRTFKNTRARVLATFGNVKDKDGKRPAGLLGLAGFGDLVWTLDYGSKRLTVED